jgi:hypothetical protein
MLAAIAIAIAIGHITKSTKPSAVQNAPDQTVVRPPSISTLAPEIIAAESLAR